MAYQWRRNLVAVKRGARLATVIGLLTASNGLRRVEEPHITKCTYCTYVPMYVQNCVARGMRIPPEGRSLMVKQFGAERVISIFSCHGFETNRGHTSRWTGVGSPSEDRSVWIRKSCDLPASVPDEERRTKMRGVASSSFFPLFPAGLRIFDQVPKQCLLRCGAAVLT